MREGKTTNDGKTTMKRKVIGYIEQVTLFSNSKKKNILAKVDTGAFRSSIDIKLASELGLEIVDVKRVRNVAASQTRPLVKLEFSIAGDRIKTTASVADRNHMGYSMIIGSTELKNFLVDPCKKNDGH
jgi:hypothetical protein